MMTAHRVSSLFLTIALGVVPMLGYTQSDTDETSQNQQSPSSQDNAQSSQGGGFVSVQQQGQLLAGELMGTAVMNGNDEELGEVQDVLLDEDQGIRALVVGVGGFLGIAEKAVAVPYDQVQQSREEDGSPKLVVQASKQQLENAPSFRTLAQKQAAQKAQQAKEKQQQQMQQQGQQQKQQMKQMQEMQKQQGQKPSGSGGTGSGSGSSQ